MQQYNSIKAKHPDAILLFRVGDFYETFGEDAVRTSRILGIVLTKRANGSASEIELAGFPHHALDNYLPKLVRAGQRVAICDQLEDPKLTKTVVKRGVTDLVSPGVTLHDQILQARSNNFLAAVHKEKDMYGLAFADVSTGEFLVSQGPEEHMDKLLQSFAPSELICSRKNRKWVEEKRLDRFYTFFQEDWIYQKDYSLESLNRHFGTASLKGFGIEEMEAGVIAAGAIFHHLKESQQDRLHHITGISRIGQEEYVWLDRFTYRNLEVLGSQHPAGTSLLDILDDTLTPMGARLLRRWLSLPLKQLPRIRERLERVDALLHNPGLCDALGEVLGRLHDMERLASKLATRRINPREWIYLRDAQLGIREIRKHLGASGSPHLEKLAGEMEEAGDLAELITTTLSDEPPVQVAKGWVIRSGVSPELDDLRYALENGHEYLQELQKRESERTGIPSLKVAFNNVFGYYLEVRNTHKDKVPADWIRKQTLVSAERYITEELKEYEQKILGAEERILALESRLYEELVQKAQPFVPVVQRNASVVARLDVLLNFARQARTHNYCKPEFHEGPEWEVKEGRHPVIERKLPSGEVYVANDVYMDREQQQILMITGPNMAGKSALLRQTALISLLAQCGCFVPAAEARLPVLDRIFVRVGAGDNISQGESTFMVEMNETASILNNLSPGSLVLLDEIGRGTSTFDGISIAWAITQYLHEHPSRPKVLFATHYHELNEMCERWSRIRNYNVSVKELEKDVIFLRKLQPGGSEHSFGLHVARMAGMPRYVLNQAEKILEKLESSREEHPEATENGEMQLSFFQLEDPLLNEIKEDIRQLDINSLTPVEALMYLNELKKRLKA